MATETKIGVGLMLLLVGVFGVLVYTKWDQHRRETLAEAGSAEISEVANETIADATGSPSAPQDAASTADAAGIVTVAAESGASATAADDWGFSSAPEQDFAAPATDVAAVDDFGFDSAPVEVREPATAYIPNDFGFERSAVQDTVAAATDAVDDFGFTAAPVETAPVDPFPTETPATQPASVAEADPLAGFEDFGITDSYEPEPYTPSGDETVASDFGTTAGTPASADEVAPAPWDAFDAVADVAAANDFVADAPPEQPPFDAFEPVAAEPVTPAPPADSDFSAEPTWDQPAVAVIEENVSAPADDWGFTPGPSEPPATPIDTPEPFFPDVEVRPVGAADDYEAFTRSTPDPVDLPRGPAIRPRRVGGSSGVTLGTPTPVDHPDLVVARGNDSFWTIAERVYGEPKFYLALAKANAGRIRQPGRLKPGMKVLTPTEAELRTKFPELCPRPTGPNGEELGGFFIDDDGRPAYRVRTNETLSHIAQNHLGRASRWVQIFELNRDRIRDVNKLKPQTVLRLPPDASRVRFAAAREGRL